MPLKEKIFWIAITVFGAGIYLIPDHKIWGIALTVIGLIGLVDTFVEHIEKNSHRERIGWALLVVTWLAIGYDLYDRHYGEDIPEATEENTLVFGWGASPNLGPESCQVEANGTRFFRFRNKFRLAIGCTALDGLTDPLDAPQLQMSRAYEITNGQMPMQLRWGPKFAEYLQGKGLNFFLLMIPNGIDPGSFSTLRQAKAMGVRKVWNGGSYTRLGIAPIAYSLGTSWRRITLAEVAASLSALAPSYGIPNYVRVEPVVNGGTAPRRNPDFECCPSRWRHASRRRLL